MRLKNYIIGLLLLLVYKVDGQTIVLKGNIRSPYDNSISLNKVEIKNNKGSITYPDLSGSYQLRIIKGDTIRFYYKQKLIDAYIYNNASKNPRHDVTVDLDESIHGGHELEAVKVYGKDYGSDSAYRRYLYEDQYNYKDPKLTTGDNQWAEYVYVMGEKMQLNSMDKKFSLLDIQSLIHVFSFKKRNKRKRDQRFAMQAEQEAYIRRRLRKDLIEKYGHIHNEDSLNVFIKRYRPSYDELKKMSDFEMCQYIAVKAKLYINGSLN